MTYTYLNATNFTGWFFYLNEITGSWFGNVMLMVVFFVLFLSMKNYTTDRSFGASSFITFIFSIFLKVAGIVSWTTVIILLVITGIALINLIFSKPEYG